MQDLYNQQYPPLPGVAQKQTSQVHKASSCGGLAGGDALETPEGSGSRLPQVNRVVYGPQQSPTYVEVCNTVAVLGIWDQNIGNS